MTQKTYDEWMVSGFHVVKGQKASGRDDSGKATFSHFQVEANAYKPDKKYYYDGKLRGEQAHNSAMDQQEDWDYEGSWEETFGGYWDNMDHLGFFSGL